MGNGKIGLSSLLSLRATSPKKTTVSLKRNLCKEIKPDDVDHMSRVKYHGTHMAAISHDMVHTK